MHTFTEAERQAALHAFRRDMFAKTTWKVVASMHRINVRLLRCFGMTLMPFSVDTVSALASALKLGQYRSAKNYLSAAKSEAERNGAAIDGTIRAGSRIPSAVASAVLALANAARASSLNFCLASPRAAWHGTKMAQ